MTKVGLYAIDKSTTLESNKSQRCKHPTMQPAVYKWVMSSPSFPFRCYS
jgi:hypothetical protein